MWKYRWEWRSSIVNYLHHQLATLDHVQYPWNEQAENAAKFRVSGKATVYRSILPLFWRWRAHLQHNLALGVVSVSKTTRSSQPFWHSRGILWQRHRSPRNVETIGGESTFISRNIFSDYVHGVHQTCRVTVLFVCFCLLDLLLLQYVYGNARGYYVALEWGVYSRLSQNHGHGMNHEDVSNVHQ